MRLLRSAPILLAAVCALSGSIVSAHSGPIARVRVVHSGLTVEPAGRPATQGRPGRQLFTADQLQTRARQRASIGFVDATVLDINQRTSLVLASSHLIRVSTGEVAPTDVPSSHLQVQTATATASAIGTHFDVWITPPLGPYGQIPPGYRKDQIIGPPGTTTVSVVAGLVRVASGYGAVLVHAGQWTHVRPGQAPTSPTGHDAGEDVAWAASLH